MTTSNAEIGWAFGPRSRNTYAPKGFRRIWVCEAAQPQGNLLRWRSSTMTLHRLRRAALHLPQRRSERGLLYFHHGLPGREKILGTETEIKIKLSDFEGFCRNLQEFSCRVLADRHFEDNCLLDFPDGKLQSSRCMIRVRNADGQAFLTYKGPPHLEGIFKVREELETRVEFSEIAIQILERIGMGICFRYQKYRREFEIDGVKVAVDETPIGPYAEFEGSEAAIRNLARKMGIEESSFLRASYYSLYVGYCKKRGESPRNMIFAKDS